VSSSTQSAHSQDVQILQQPIREQDSGLTTWYQFNQ